MVCMTTSLSTYAKSVSLEVDSNPNFKPAPEAIRALPAIEDMGHFCKDVAVAPLSLSNQAGKQYFVVAGCMGGSAAAPFWIVEQRGEKFRVLLEEGSYTLDILNSQHHGLRDIAVFVGHAGYCKKTIYQFNGSQYRKYKNRDCSK